MKVQVKDLMPNPYRNMGSYPIDRAKVEQLKLSIKDLTFWDNILVRKNNNGEYEIAYGHHRWVALKELGIKEIDIPVRDLDDATMIRIMAEENLNWVSSPAVINETVLAVKKFLDDELDKYETLKELKLACESTGKLFDNQQAFSAAKREDKGKVGGATILRFLGGNWKETQIAIALRILRDSKLPISEGGVDRKAAEILPSMDRADNFRREVSKRKIPKPLQHKIAKKLVELEVTGKNIPEFIDEIVPLPTKAISKSKPKPMPMLDDIIKEISGKMTDVRILLKRTRKDLENVQSGLVALTFKQEGEKLLVVMNTIFGKDNKNEEAKKKV